MATNMRIDNDLRRAGADLATGLIGRTEHRKAILPLVQRQFGCSRVSLWRMNGKSAGSGVWAVQCLAAYAADAGFEPGGPESLEREYRAYLAILAGTGSFACEDTWARIPLQPAAPGPSTPPAYRAVLMAAFMLNGKPWGALSCEHITCRVWAPSESADLKRYASIVAVHVSRLDTLEKRRASANAG